MELEQSSKCSHSQCSSVCSCGAGQGYEPQNCKTWIEGQFHFTYEVDKGGGGICDSRDSVVNATQRQGSAYLDNTYLIMTFGVCPGIMNTGAPEVRYNCLGSWFDQRGNTWAALVDSGEQVKRFRYRCIVRTALSSISISLSLSSHPTAASSLLSSSLSHSPSSLHSMLRARLVFAL